MPRPGGLFDSFDNLDTISAEDIAVWLKPIPQIIQLENYLANRILYPQTIPFQEADTQIDLAILREALKKNNFTPNNEKPNALLGDSPFLNTTLRKILIPVKFLDFVPDLQCLARAFVDALLFSKPRKDWFEDLWTIVLTDDVDEIVGSLIRTQFEGNAGVMSLKLLGKNYQIHPGDITIIPCSKDRCEIAYTLQSGRVLGKTESAIEVFGGKLGLMIDGRGT